MSFKILLPVTTSPELVKQKLEDLKGYEQNTIVVNNWTNPEVATIAKEFAARGAEAYDCSYNLGLGGTWNFGMKRMEEDNCDFIIILAPSAVFTKSIQYFIDAILENEQQEKKCRYVAGAASLHCFAHTRLGLELNGYFDENFWPIYYEDTDWARRSTLNKADEKVKNLCLDIVHSHSYSISCRSDAKLMWLHQNNCDRWSKYYIRKWGGDHHSEVFEYPFNDPSKETNDWKIEGPFIHFAYPNFVPMPPQTSQRY